MESTITMSLKEYNDLKLIEKAFKENSILFSTYHGTLELMEEVHAIRAMNNTLNEYKKTIIELQQANKPKPKKKRLPFWWD